ncbi:MAG: LytTR family DNA-binding domain-containing protein [Oscillospiraceae bacterium]
MFHIAICDDLSADRRALQALLTELIARRRLQASFTAYDSGEALAASGGGFDLIFLDIFMGGLNGMETAKLLRSAGMDTPLVFLTTSPDFAVESYQVEALSYLLKPVTAETLSAVLDRFLREYHPSHVLLQNRLFMADDIVSAESQNKTVLLHFKNGATATLSEKLDVVEAALRGRNFLRCHKSFIVNMDHVRHIEADGFQTTLDSFVPIRQREFAQIRKKYYEYLTSL